MGLDNYKKMLVFWRNKDVNTNKGSFNEDLYLKILKKRGMKMKADRISLYQFTLKQI